MTDITNAPDGANEPNEPVQIADLPEEIRAYIKDLREEAKNNRLAATQAKSTVSEAEKELQRLKAQAEADKLKTVEELQAAVAEKAAREQALQQELSDFRSGVQQSNEKRIEAIPEKFRPMVPDYGDPVKTAQWLDANEANLKATTLPDTDAGQTGPAPGAGTKLTPEQQAAARELGVDFETLAKYN